MNQIIEVKIVKKNINYIATTQLFPKCKGVGKTKKEAMAKLSGSISNFISNIIRSTLGELFQSNNYTQVILDHSKESKTQTLAFNLNKKTQDNLQKTFLLRVSSVTEEDEDEADEDEADEDEAVESDTAVSNIRPMYESMSTKSIISQEIDFHYDAFEQLIAQEKLNQDPDEIIFGFPLNLN